MPTAESFEEKLFRECLAKADAILAALAPYVANHAKTERFRRNLLRHRPGSRRPRGARMESFLILVAANPGITVREVEAVTGMRRDYVTKLARRAASRDLIRREIDQRGGPSRLYPA